MIEAVKTLRLNLDWIRKEIALQLFIISIGNYKIHTTYYDSINFLTIKQETA